MNTDIQNNIQIPEEEGIDIKKYIFLILSHWWWFAITFMVSLSLVYLINRYTQEVYNTNCTVIVGEEQSSAGSVENLLDEMSRYRGKRRKAVVENEISILKSYKMARLALEELDFGITYTAVGRRNIAETQLYKNSPFVVLQNDNQLNSLSGTYNITILSDKKYLLSIDEDNQMELSFSDTTLFKRLGFTIILRDSANFIFNPQKSNKYYFTVENINTLAKGYSRALAVDVNADKGSILFLNISGFVPEKICDYLNKLSEVYIRSNLEEKNLASKNTIQFIDDQLRGVIDSLEVTGLRLQQFRSANKVINLSKEGAFLYEKMQNLQSEKAILDIGSSYYKYLQEYIKERTDFSDVIAPSIIGIADPLLNSLVAKLNTLNLDRRNLSLSVMDNSPQLSILHNQISNTIDALKENLISLIEANEIAKRQLNQRIAKIEKEVQKLPGTERQMINIEREFTINDQIYTFLLEKRAEAGITKASNTSDHTILDVARPDNTSKIKPKSSSNYMMALAMGGVIPLAILILLDFFNTKITDRKQLESSLRTPIIGNIGHNDNGGELPVNENPRSTLAESFRALRTNLQYMLKEPDSKVIVVSSAISGEGKTFCSVNLSSILAMNGKKTLIVSLDLRRPKVHRVFNLPNETGMSTYLIDKCSFDNVISETNFENLFVATSGPIPPNPAELLSSQKMVEFIENAKARFDYIILDTPPVAIVTDTLTIKNLIDTFIFVIRHNYSDKQVIDLINSIHDKHLMKSIGVIINDIQIKGYYGYSYRYNYEYNYNKTYYEGDEGNKKNKGILKRFLKR